VAGLKANLPASVDPAAIDQRTGKPKRISAKVKRAVDLLLTGACTTQVAAAERAGLHEKHLSRAFKQPHVIAHIDQRTRAHLSEGKLVASARLLELVRADSEHVSFDASRHVLAISNIRPPDAPPSAVSVNINNVQAGYVVDLSPQQPIGEQPSAKISNESAVIIDAPQPQGVDWRNIRPVGFNPGRDG
jgi:hypothetical protein